MYIIECGYFVIIYPKGEGDNHNIIDRGGTRQMQKFLEKTVEVELRDDGGGNSKIVLKYYLTKKSTDGEDESGDTFGIGITKRIISDRSCTDGFCNIEKGSSVFREKPVEAEYNIYEKEGKVANENDYTESNYMDEIHEDSSKVRSLLDMMIYNIVFPNELPYILDDLLGAEGTP